MFLRRIVCLLSCPPQSSPQMALAVRGSVRDRRPPVWSRREGGRLLVQAKYHLSVGWFAGTFCRLPPKRANLILRACYRVTLVVAYLGWVNCGFGHSSVFGQMEIWQNGLVDRAQYISESIQRVTLYSVLCISSSWSCFRASLAMLSILPEEEDIGLSILLVAGGVDHEVQAVGEGT